MAKMSRFIIGNSYRGRSDAGVLGSENQASRDLENRRLDEKTDVQEALDRSCVVVAAQKVNGVSRSQIENLRSVELVEIGARIVEQMTRAVISAQVRAHRPRKDFDSATPFTCRRDSHSALRERATAVEKATADLNERHRDVVELEQTRPSAEWADAEAAEKARALGKTEPKRTHTAQHDRKLESPPRGQDRRVAPTALS